MQKRVDPEGNHMDKMIDKGLLFALSCILLLGSERFLEPVVAILSALVYLSLSLYLTDKRVITGLMVLMVGLSFYWKELSVFLPLLCYDSIGFSLWWGIGLALVGIAPMMECFPAGKTDGWRMALWFIVYVMALVAALRTRKLETMKREYIHLRDETTEGKLLMQKRQKELLEKQDYEIHLATLQERNRIAREIHDNVGHMLTRSILQMGALLTIHKEEPMHGQLEAVNDTLNSAMNSIRESVHDLHNDSMDLKQMVLDVTEELKSRCQVVIDYDMSAEIPRNVKYCLIAIVKEAVSNITKHSNASRVSIFLREHPGFYQMSVEDNGTDIHMSDNPGIGLSNITDRAEALGGNAHFFTEKGFRILVSLPKANSAWTDVPKVSSFR